MRLSVLSLFKDAHRFGDQITKALHDLLKLLNLSPKEPSKMAEGRAEVKKEK